MSRYVFSGNLTDKMVKYLQNIPWFHPIDVLVSQLDRNSISKMLEYKDMGIIRSLFIDSGAYSVYTGKSDPIDVDKYIEFINSLDDSIYAAAQVDTIPGRFGQPKCDEDYEVSADKSWENYLYMRKHMKSPEKLVSVFHFGESFQALGRMLDYRDSSVHDKALKHSDVLGDVYPDRLNIVGLSPANDSHQSIKDIYLNECYNYIANSSYPDVKTHLFGMTSLKTLSKIPYYSADSVSHRLRSAYNKVYTRKYGVISLSDTRKSRVKSNQSFLRRCDSSTLQDLKEFFESYGFTIDQMKDDNAARCVVDMCETQQAVENEYSYKPGNSRKSKRLF